MPAMAIRRSTARSARLLTDTGLASGEVITRRLAGFATPGASGSARQQREATRMVTEKVQAGIEGAGAAGLALTFLPMRAWAAFADPRALTPAGYATACGRVASLWMEVGQAALAPARHKAVANRRRLARQRTR